MQHDLGIMDQVLRACVIAAKSLRIFYLKGPVVIFGLLFPAFLFLSFAIGRAMTVGSMLPGLLGIILFFTATSISPVVVPWEGQARTLERLMSCPVRAETIIVGDVIASFIFGIAISLVPIIIGLVLGVTVTSPVLLAFAVLLAALCFASLGNLFSIPPVNTPSTVNMIAAAVRFPVIFISGVFIPLDQLPTWAQVVSYVSPLTYFVDIARTCMQGTKHLAPALDLGILALFTGLFLLVAMRMHRGTMPRRI